MIPAPPDWDQNQNRHGHRPWNPHMPPKAGHPLAPGTLAVRVTRYPTVAMEVVTVEEWFAHYQRDWMNQTELKYRVKRPDGSIIELYDEYLIEPGSPEWEKVKIRSEKALAKYQERFNRFAKAEVMARHGQIESLEPPKAPKKSKTKA